MEEIQKSDNSMVNIPYVVYEGTQARNERTIKRLVMMVVLSIVLLFVSNGLWLHAWMQYDYSSTSDQVTVDGKDGVANYIGNNGDITNGESYSN